MAPVLRIVLKSRTLPCYHPVNSLPPIDIPFPALRSRTRIPAKSFVRYCCALLSCTHEKASFLFTDLHTLLQSGFRQPFSFQPLPHSLGKTWGWVSSHIRHTDTPRHGSRRCKSCEINTYRNQTIYVLWNEYLQKRRGRVVPARSSRKPSALAILQGHGTDHTSGVLARHAPPATRHCLR